MCDLRLPVLGFLFVSFRPSLIRSHSCSSGADLFLSVSVFSASDLLALARFSSASGYLAFLFFRSLLPGSASQLLSRCAISAFASPAFRRPSARLPALPVRFWYLAFLLVSFRPSQFRSRSRFPGACLPLSPSAFSVPRRFLINRVGSLLTTQLSAPLFPSSRSPPAVVPSVLRSACASRLSPSVAPVSMRPFRFWYSALCSSVLPRPARLAVAASVRPGLPFGLAGSPSLSLRFRLLGLSVLNFSVHLRPRIYYHRILNLSTPIFYIFQLLSCIILPVHFNCSAFLRLTLA